MHCWKIINVERDFGATRIILLSCIFFFFTFSFSYVLLSLNFKGNYTDQHLWINFIAIILLYPVHKFIHYLFFIDYSKSIRTKIRLKFGMMPIIHLKITRFVPKYRYILSLVGPFIFLNGLLLYAAIIAPTYTHYFCFFFGIHSAICLIDLLNVKSIIRAPHNSIIEETPKGYEILVPL